MKRVLSVVFVFVLLSACGGSSFPQDNVGSLFLKFADKEVNKIPWLLHYGNTFVDARFNFDWPNTLTMFVGKKFGQQTLNATPAVGVLMGEYEGFSGEVYVGGELGRFSTFGINQLTLSTNGLSNWAYHWSDCFYQPTRWLKVGVGEQVYHEFVHDYETKFDFGPVAKISIGRFFVKPWHTWSPTHHIQKTFIGVGASW